MASTAMSSSVRVRAAPFALACALLACAAAPLGCSNVVWTSVEVGAYENHELTPGPLRLDVDRAASTITFTRPGAPAIVRPARALDRDKWPTRCRMNFKSARTELLDIGPDPLDLGGKKVERPVVLAGCYRSNEVELESLGADGSPDSSVFVTAFHR